MRAHFAWLHVLLCRIRKPHSRVLGVFTPWIDRVLQSLDRRTQNKSIAFDRRCGTSTYGRMDVAITQDAVNPTIWGYSAVNHDFFREIMRAIPLDLTRYTFVDVGAGKGAAVLMASDFPFKRLMGIELNQDLVDIARNNVVQFNHRIGRSLNPEWFAGDYFQWNIPDEPCLFFLNNPFPEALSLQALEHLERLLAHHPHPTLLVFRKAPKSSGDHLNRSGFWKPIRLAPYWRVYSFKPVPSHVS